MAEDTNVNANAEAARLRKSRAKFKAEADSLRAQLAELTRERDQLKATVESAPGEAGKEVERLKGELRVRDHRAAFDKLAAGKIRPNALDAAWKLSGWAADSDEIDETKLTENIDGLVAANDFLAVEAAESNPSESGSPSSGRSAGQSGPPTPSSGFGRGPAPQESTGTQPAVFRLV